jgi:putative ATPase involved in DNA repair
MGWTSIPNFGDKYAKVRERTHSSGAKLIEVLYGARDNKGRPTSPESNSDGHGHWLAIEIDGIYQMLSWRHPIHEGGLQEYGRGRRSNALSDLESDIIAKEKICSQAESLSLSSEWKTAAPKFKQLSNEWKKVYNWGTPKEKQLWEHFQAAKKRFYERRENNRSKYFSDLNKQRVKNRQMKQALISEARSVSQFSTDWKQTGDKLHELMERWKEVGSVDKEYNDSLWNEFNGIRQDFFNRRRIYYEERDRLFQENSRRKGQIVQEAANIASRSDYSVQTTERMKELDREWRNIGSAGKINEHQLWSLFQSAKDSFWSSKRSYNERNQQEWRRKLYDAINRKREQISNLEQQISDLQYKMSSMRNQEYINNMYRWIDEKKAKIRELEIAIQDMESKL